jgi:hypothetical protein
LSNISVSRLISPNFGWADVIPQRVLHPPVQGVLSEDSTLSGSRRGQSAGAINGSASGSADTQASLADDERAEPSEVSSSAA